MTITENASSPGATAGTGTGSTITSASFTPPSGTLIVVMLSGEWSPSTVTQQVTDSRHLTWTPIGRATGTTRAGGVAAIYCTYVTSSPGAMTVTASFTGLGGGRFLDVRVLNGADPVQTALTGWAQTRSTLVVANGLISVITTEAGSVVYGISDAGTTTDSFTATSGVTTIGQHVNTVDYAGVASWKYTTSVPGSVTLGGTWSDATAGNVVAFEVLPLGGSAVVPTLPTFLDGTVPRAADLNAVAFNIKNLFAVAGGGQRYAPYEPGGKGPIKPLTVLGVTNPSFGFNSGQLTFMVWDTPYVNSDNAWNVLAPSLMYFNTPGLYRLHFQMQVLSVSACDIETVIMINGSATSNGIAIANTYGTSGGCSVSARISAGAFAYCAATQWSGNPATAGATQFVAEYFGA